MTINRTKSKFSYNQVISVAGAAKNYLDHCGSCGEPAGSLIHDPRYGVGSKYHRFLERRETKWTYGLKRIQSQFGDRVDDPMKREIEKIRTKHCLTEPPNNPDGRILRDEKGNY